MPISNQLIRSLLALFVLLVAASAALAQSGTPAVNDQKVGSVLVYNFYTSGMTSGNQENTRVSITNTNRASGVSVHFFFVDGSNCSTADGFVCLTPDQKTYFLASDVDPGVLGYVIAVAVDSANGFPINFNFLIGEEYVKLASGHHAKFNAETLAAYFKNGSLGKRGDPTVQMNFDGKSYDQVPHTLALSDIPSPADGNSTLLVINRIGGNLAASAGPIGRLSGVLFDDAENAFGFTTFGGCQLGAILSNDFPVTMPSLTAVIPGGRSGWMRLAPTSNVGILGAAINFNPSAGIAANAFSGGGNLHHLTLTTDILIIPISPPIC